MSVAAQRVTALLMCGHTAALVIGASELSSGHSPTGSSSILGIALGEGGAALALGEGRTALALLGRGGQTQASGQQAKSLVHVWFLRGSPTTTK